MYDKTICAISTPRGKGGVAMIRISGSDALVNAKKFVKIHSADTEITPRKCYYCDILRSGERIDDATMTFFKAPNSFTGEDVVEICCHGGIYVTGAVLECALSSGCSMAEAGEFTKRAYINGKLTLSGAEAVGLIIDAKTDAQMRLSQTQARGVLSKKVDHVRSKMLDLLSHIYATIDYPEEDLPSVERDGMQKTLDEIYDEISTLKNSYRAGKAICDGVKTAIIGKPNAGKSSLYNLILGEDVAIVTDIAGTTRDIIEHTASIGEVTLNLADTAGIRDTFDEVEKIGVERAKKKVEASELIICVFDTSEKENEQDEFIIEIAKGKSAIAILNKTDKEKKISKDFEEKIKSNFENVIYMSTNERGEAFATLGRVINEMFDLGKIDISSDAIITNARQFSSVNIALEKVREAKETLCLGETNDIVCFALEDALSELGFIDRREANEEIVNQIFSRFCVGK